MSGKMPRLVIQMMPDGRTLQVSGPLEDKSVCLQMLDEARQIIRDFAPPVNGPPKIVLPAAFTRPGPLDPRIAGEMMSGHRGL